MSEEVKQGAGMFGITQETKSTNNVPLLTPTKLNDADAATIAEFPSGWKFPTARLVNVVSNPEFEKKDGSKAPILSFTFADNDRRQYTHIEWEVDSSDAKAKEKVDWMNSRIKHIYEAVFGNFPEKGIGTNATNWTEFFNAVAAAFNGVTTRGKNAAGEEKTIKVYTQIPLYYKLTYYKGNLRFPLAPNFVERNEPNKPCKILTVDQRYDQVENDAKPKGGGIPGIGGATTGGGGTDDLPSFDEAYT